MSHHAMRRALIPWKPAWIYQPCGQSVRCSLVMSSSGARSRRREDRPATLAHVEPRPLVTSRNCVIVTQASNLSRSSEERRGRTSQVVDHVPLRGKPPEHANAQDLVAVVEHVARLFVAQLGVPSEGVTLAALRACAKADVKQLIDDAEQGQPEDSRPQTQSQTTASHLLDLAGSSRQGKTAISSMSDPTSAQDLIDRVSEAAYIIITHPTVVITPHVLEEYIKVQARLGKPETLPQVLALRATKPRPRLVSGKFDFAVPSANRIEHAVDAAVAELALDTALQAKNLDAAIGIIEHSYATPAFRRFKLVRHALISAGVFAALPTAAYQLAATLSHLQVAMDPAIATNIAFTGIMAYGGFTAIIGMLVITTANDQMKRVTWTLGIPLRERWLREEERAALDRVACAFGFSEPHRYGEEQGAEFKSLREYLVLKGMVLDAVELMEGMT